LYFKKYTLKEKKLMDLLKIYKQGEDDPNAAAFYLENPQAVLVDFSGGFEKINM
jgi:uncharacterized pyridoxamine 5'-phosphate oxidase family protein